MNEFELNSQVDYYKMNHSGPNNKTRQPTTNFVKSISPNSWSRLKHQDFDQSDGFMIDIK